MQLHLLSGFLGSGKTTAIQHACKVLIQQGYRVGVITNDQGIRLVDDGFFKRLGIPGRQVANGCFCCNYNALDESIQSLLDENNPDIIFAESVGSCTDLVATVFKPLLQFRPQATVTVSTFADARLLLLLLQNNAQVFDEAVHYIYNKQLEEAGLVIINKTDLLSAAELETVKALVQESYPGKMLLHQNSQDDADILQWLQTLQQAAAFPLTSLNINYEVYGAGEAKLAWLDEVLEIKTSNNNAQQVALQLAEKIYSNIQEKQYPIGHVKYLLDGETKISYTATASLQVMPVTIPRSSAVLLINARVQTAPEILQALVAACIREVENSYACSITVQSLQSFKPGYPQPTHRIANVPGAL